MPDVVKRLGHHARLHAMVHYNAADTYQSTLDLWEGMLRWDALSLAVDG